jgi:tetratricopeptide (TPR) repeat protein
MASTIAAREATLLATYRAEASAMERVRALVALSEHRLSYGDVLMAERALGDADQIMPRHGDLILRRARLLVQRGQWRESLICLDQVLDADRNRAAFWLCVADTYRHAQMWLKVKAACQAGLAFNQQSQGLLLLDACADGHAGNWKAATTTFAALAPKAENYEMFAAAQAHHKQSQEALDTLERGVTLFPGNPRLISAICMLKWMLGDATNFAKDALGAVQQFPNDLMAHMTAADLLRRGGQIERAIDILRHAKQRFQAHQLDCALALLLSSIGALDDAQALVKQANQVEPRLDWIARNSAVIHLGARNQIAAAEYCAWGLGRDSLDQEWIALDAITKRLNDDPKYHNIYDYKAFVGTAKVDLQTSLGSHDTNFKALNEAIRDLHRYANHPLDQSLRSGSQLPLDPQLRMQEPFATFFKAIEGPIHAYLAKLGTQPHHPFLSRNNGGYEMAGAWSVRLRRGGQHVNHIHPEGWVSAVFYLSLPNDTVDFVEGEGDLCFGQPNFTVKGLLPDFKVTPKESELILFPSYFWHGTVPLSKSEDRLTLAFDIIPRTTIPDFLEARG